MRRGRLLILVLLLVVVIIGGIFVALFLAGGNILRPGGDGGGGGGLLGGSSPTPVEVTATPEPILNILAAAQNLERGAIIPTEAIIAIPWPTSIVPPSAITDTEQVVGSRARYTIERGEPIFSTLIVKSLQQLSPTGSDIAAQIPPGSVAISVPYERTSGVALGIQDGDHVNVIVSWSIVDIDQSFQSVLPNLTAYIIPISSATLSCSTGSPGTCQWVTTPGVTGAGSSPTASVGPVVVVAGGPAGPVGRGETDSSVDQDFYVVPSEPQRPRLVTQAIIQDALVLHLGDFGVQPPPAVAQTAAPPVEGATPTTEAPPTPTPLPPDIITLVVPPQDALVLNYINRLMEKYPRAVEMTLVLRSAGDTTLTETESVTLQYMFERFNIALPAKLNYGVAALLAPTATPAP